MDFKTLFVDFTSHGTPLYLTLLSDAEGAEDQV